MARYSFKKGSKEWNMMGDFYKLCEDFWIPEPIEDNNPDDYWGRLMKECDKFIQKYDGNIFARFITHALMDSKNQESLEAKEAEHG